MKPLNETLTPAAKKVVRAAIANIRSKPNQFDMDHWIGTPVSRSCGHSACLAGHIVLAAGLKPYKNDISYVMTDALEGNFGKARRSDSDRGSELTSVYDAARTILGISKATGQKLFLSAKWPRDLRNKFEALTYDEYGNDVETTPDTLKKRAALAIKRLRLALTEGK